MRPLVSVVGSYHDRAPFVERSVGAVLSQTFSDFEFIVVDDGSRDSTLERLQAFESDRRVRLISLPNVGFLAAIRIAIASSSGKYVAVHGAGEIWREDFLNSGLEVLEGDEGLVLYGARALSSFEGIEQESALPTGDLRKALDQRNIFVHGATIYRRDVYEQVGGYRPPFVYGQDFDLWLRMADIGRIYLDPAIRHERVRIRGGVSTSPEKLLLQTVLRSLSRWSAAERRQGRDDPLDFLGFSSLAWRPPDRRLGRDLTKQAFAFLAIGDLPSAAGFCDASRREKTSLPIRTLRLGVRASVRFSVVRRLLLRLVRRYSILRFGRSKWVLLSLPDVPA